VERTAEALRDVDRDSVRKVMQDNACRLYRLEPPE
jgi:predicted metal-dependent TIM-barrel fold hydrolase